MGCREGKYKQIADNMFVETLAGFVGNYLTKETGVTVVFESAIVPRWKDNCIQFKNVFVSRRPRYGKNARRSVSKGSVEIAAAAAAAAITADNNNPAEAEALHIVEEAEEDTNYTQFDVTIETVNVTLSFARWMNGKGLLKDVEIKGVRGVIDRTNVHWDSNPDPRSLRREHCPGDFEIESFKLEDLLVTVYQPGGFRAFSASIYSCDLPQLRKQWLFYDFLSANNCSGSFDDSLFTIHPRQSHSIGPSSRNSPSPWKKTSRLRIDGLEIDHLNRGIEGPFSWIRQGNVDIVMDVNFPLDDDLQFSRLVQELYERMEATVISSTSDNDHYDFASIVSSIRNLGQKEGEKKFLVMDLHVQLNDVRAAVPIFTNDLSYVNNAMIRPIVAYVNSKKTYIPINCRVIKELGEFNGSWTIFDSGLMDDLSAEVS
jgi:distribution and morphology protein 31